MRDKKQYLPPLPVCMTSIPPLSKLLSPSNCSTVHLYHLIKNTRNVRPCDTITKFMFGDRSPGGWKRPMSISALRVSLKPVAVTLHNYEAMHLREVGQLCPMIDWFIWLKQIKPGISQTCDSVIDISSWFPIWKPIEETAITVTYFFLNSHFLPILKVSYPMNSWIKSFHWCVQYYDTNWKANATISQDLTKVSKQLISLKIMTIFLIP